MRAKELVKLIEKDGWKFNRQTGSHRIFAHESKKGIVVVPIHGGDIPKGTLKSILKQADLEK
jgi:predicted RNA binding protein YcfA (HicA-like mRNA interferase family)